MSNPKFKMVGKLTIDLVECKGLTIKQLIGSMDPYVTFTLSGSKEKHKSKVHKNGHDNPRFNQSFVFNLEGAEDMLHITVMDVETLSDQVLGRIDLSLDAMDLSGEVQKYGLRDPSNFAKMAGDIYFSASFDGFGVPPESHAGKTLKAKQDKENAAKAPAPAPAPTPTPAPAPAPAPVPAPVQPQVVVVQQPPQPVYPPQPQVIYTQPPPQPRAPVAYPVGQPQFAYPPQPVYQNTSPFPQPQPVYQAPPAYAYGQPAPQQVVYQQPGYAPPPQAYPPQQYPPQQYPPQQYPPQQYPPPGGYPGQYRPY